MKRLLLLLVPAALLIAASASADVVVERNAAGHYGTIHVTTSLLDGQLLFWASAHSGPDVLNPLGDENGDLEPSVVVLQPSAPLGDPSPLVVWSRNYGTEMNLVWSRWKADGGWTTPKELTNPNDADDVGLHLLVDRGGTVHVVWWSNTDIPSIWYSHNGDGCWANPERISAIDRDSRNPFLVLTPGGSLYANHEDWSLRPVRRVTTFLKETFDP